MIKFLTALLFVPCFSWAGAGAITVTGPFVGLNDTDPSITMDGSQTPDTLNVEVSKDGLALQKRKGYSQIAALTVTTAPVYGSIYFRDSSGHNIKIFAHDRYVSKSVDGAAFVNFVTTATAGTKWSFCESAGKMFAFNDAYDIPWSYDGTTIINYPDMPNGSICAMSPTRMLIAGTTDFPNRLYFSESGNYTNFTLGTTVDSPSFDDIGLAGEKITGLFAAQSEWLIFKTNSVIDDQGTNQYDLVASVISDKIGLVDPHAIVEHAGVVYFKSTDGKIYGYSSGQLQDLTSKQENFTANIAKDFNNLQLYTDKAHFDTGTYTLTDGGITPNSVVPSSWSDMDDSSDFSGGTYNRTELSGGSIKLVTTKLNPNANLGFEGGNATGWVTSGGDISGVYYGITPFYNSYMGLYTLTGYSCGTTTTFTLTVYTSTGGVLSSIEILQNGANTEKSVELNGNRNIYMVGAFGTCTVTYSTVTVGSNTLYFKAGRQSGYSSTRYYFDSAIIPSSGSYTSSIKNTGFSLPIFSTLVLTTSVPTGSQIDFFVKQSSSIYGAWSDWSASSDTLRLSTTQQFIQYKLDLYETNSTSVPSVSSVYLKAESTGTWTSPIVNLSSFSSFGTMSCSETTQNQAHWTCQIKASSTQAGLTGESWTTVADGANIGISTAQYAQVRAVNSFVSSTETVQLDSIGFNYNFITPHQCSAFEYNGDIYFNVPYGLSQSVNNRTMKLDLLHNGWQIFDIPMNHPLITGGLVYFGSPSSGYVYAYPSGDNDNGSAINSYWKTKNYMGTNAYVEKNFDKLSMIAGSDYGSNLDITYTMDTSTSTSFSVVLTSTTQDFIRINRQLPIGEIGTFWNMQIGNNASNQPWKFYGANVDYTDAPWRVQPE